MLPAIRRKLKLYPVFSKAIPAVADNDGQGLLIAKFTVFTMTPASLIVRFAYNILWTHICLHNSFKMVRKLIYEDKIHIYLGCVQGFRPILRSFLRVSCRGWTTSLRIAWDTKWNSVSKNTERIQINEHKINYVLGHKHRLNITPSGMTHLCLWQQG